MASKGSTLLESAITASKNGRPTAAFVPSVNRPGVYWDRCGLRLRAFASRNRKSILKHWVWQGSVNGARQDVGLNLFPNISLIDARQSALLIPRDLTGGR